MDRRDDRQVHLAADASVDPDVDRWDDPVARWAGGRDSHTEAGLDCLKAAGAQVARRDVMSLHLGRLQQDARLRLPVVGRKLATVCLPVQPFPELEDESAGPAAPWA